MTTTTAIQTPRERVLVALTRLAAHQGHTVPADRMTRLAIDLEPYAWSAIIAALDAHRKASVYFPKFAELRPYLEPETRVVAGLRGQSAPSSFHPHRIAASPSIAVVDPDVGGAPYRFHCSHAPTCATWPAHRALILGDADATLAALNDGWRQAHGADDPGQQSAGHLQASEVA